MLFFSTKIIFSNFLKSSVNVHSDKFIRLSRSAKLAKISPSFKEFTFFKSPKILTQHNKLNLNTKRNSSADLTKNESNCKGDGLPQPGRVTASRRNNQLSLLFLNQGLESSDLIKLRWYLKFLGINITQIPSRFWSNTLIHSKRQFISFQDYKINLKQLIHGNILLFHTFWPSVSEATTLGKQREDENKQAEPVNFNPLDQKNFPLDSYLNQNNDSIYYLYKLIQNNLAKGSFNFSWKKNELNLNSEILSSFQTLSNSNTQLEQTKYFQLENPTIPWELVAAEPETTLNKDISKNSDTTSANKIIIDFWLKTKDTTFSETLINLFLIHLKNNNLLYAGLLNLSTVSSTEKEHDNTLFFDNINNIRYKQTLSQKNKKDNTFVLYQKTAQDSFEPFFFNCFNRKYLLFF